MTYSAVRSAHYAALKPAENRKVKRHRHKADRIHKLMMQTAARWGADAVLADVQAGTGGFLDEILAAIAGWFIPLIGPAIVRILLPIIISMIEKAFSAALVTAAVGAATQSVDDMLKRLAAEAEAEAA